MSTFYNIKSATQKLFGENVELLPSVTELFELELAYWEYKCLSIEQLIEKSAYIKSIDGKETNHYLFCSSFRAGTSGGRSAMTNSYFENGMFSTGYATHGLFPYRGKFHPQLIRAILNIMDLSPGDTVLDPMAGSGTTNIEAALMGINSIAADVSPFCRFMIKAKYDSMKIDLNILKECNIEHIKLFEYFSHPNALENIARIPVEKKSIYELALLAYLDSLGYSKRVVKSNHLQLFEKVLDRYISTIKTLLKNVYFNRMQLGEVQILGNSDALDTGLGENSVDAVITSPPYSFAIDYVENDRCQLEFLGYNTDVLREKLIGLKGKNKQQRLDNYFSDMDKVCLEVSRVLKNKKYFVMIIGSNTKQTGGIRLEQNVIDSANKYGLEPVKSILKPIKGMRNTMKDEYVLFFRKG